MRFFLMFVSSAKSKTPWMIFILHAEMGVQAGVASLFVRAVPTL